MTSFAAIAQAQCPNGGCCPANPTPTYGGMYCNASQQTTVANVAISSTVVTGHTMDCTVDFDYTWPLIGPGCPATRDIRWCMAACERDENPCESNCINRCGQSTGESQGTKSFTEQFTGLQGCYYCHLVVIDVTGNSSCYTPLSSYCNLGSLGACSTNCGQPIIEGKSDCESF